MIVEVNLDDLDDRLEMGEAACLAGRTGVNGGDGDDRLVGGPGPDLFNGDRGADLMIGGAGDDTLDAGRIVSFPGQVDDDGNDVLDGGEGSDRLSGGPGDDRLDAGPGDDGIATSPNLNINGVDGGPGGDHVAGGAGNDVISGGVGSDVVEAGEGDDQLDVPGFSFIDRFAGPQGNDRLDGGPGDDVFTTETGDDAAGDVIRGGDGSDAISYAIRTAPVSITLDGIADDGAAGEGDDIGADVERITGGADSDSLIGADGANVFDGGPGDDRLAGGGGDDVLEGGAEAGSDSLDGGEGADSLRGGDLRGSMAIAEALPAERVLEVFDTFLSEMTDAVLTHGGTLVHFGGDSVLAAFGAPLEQPDHADRALACAREMAEVRLAAVNRTIHEQELTHEDLRVGIGVNSGAVASGTIGSPRRLVYTVLGDTVNTAARLESMTKDSEHVVLVSDTTRAMLRHDIPGLVYVDAISVRGKQVKANLWTFQPERDVADRALK